MDISRLPAGIIGYQGTQLHSKLKALEDASYFSPKASIATPVSPNLFDDESSKTVWSA